MIALIATIAVEAHLELQRVQAARKLLLASNLRTDPGDLDSVEAENLADVLPLLSRLERYERRAVSRRNRALQLL